MSHRRISSSSLILLAACSGVGEPDQIDHALSTTGLGSTSTEEHSDPATDGDGDDDDDDDDGDTTTGSPEDPRPPSIPDMGVPIPPGDPCNGPPRVIYLDDGGVPNDDPNGVQDLAIVLGWADQIDLIAIGSTSWNDGSAEFLQSIVDEAGSDVPVLTEQTLIDTIIDEARATEALEGCPDDKLHVAIGGEWFKLATALTQAPDIADRIALAAIGGWNIRIAQTPEGIPRDAHDTIVAHLGEANIFRIDDKDEVGPGEPDFRDAYEVEPGYSVADLDAFYDDNLRPLLVRIPDPSNPALNITEESSYYISHTRLLNLNQGEGDGSNGSKLRIADFLTVAHVIWGPEDGFDIFDKDDVYPQIAAGLASLP